MSSILAKNENVKIREVWRGNLEADFALIREIVDEFSYVAMDTEFPRMVIRLLGTFRSSSEFNHATLKANVDTLKLFQLGLTFSDELGNLPVRGAGRRGCVWQFNFRGFDACRHAFTADSIKDYVGLLGVALRRYGYAVDPLLDVLAKHRDNYHDLLLADCRRQVSEALAADAFEQMLMKKEYEYSMNVLTFQLQTSDIMPVFPSFHLSTWRNLAALNRSNNSFFLTPSVTTYRLAASPTPAPRS